MANNPPIIDKTKPAVAIPVGFFFLPIIANTIPTIPSIKPITDSPIKLNTIATMPNTKAAIANPLDFFSSINTSSLFRHNIHLLYIILVTLAIQN